MAHPLFPRRVRLCLAFTASGLLAACAAQSPPVPPRIEHPVAVKDLKVEEIGRGIEIKFTLPTLATDGESLTKPLEVEIFREAASPLHKPSPVSSSPKPWISLSAEQVGRNSQGGVFADRASLSDQEFQSLLNSTLRFSVVTLTRGFRHRPIRSAPSNPASTTVLDVSAPPAKPSVVTTEKALVLHWTPPAESLSGKPISNLSGYRIYASPDGRAASFRLIGESKTPQFSDSDFQFGTHYFFRVRAVFTVPGTTAESADSEVAEVTPQDVFPPAVPQGLSAIQTSAGVELVWHPDSEPDLAGYRVYRREDANPWELLNRELARTPVYRDDSASAGRSYYYSVSAVDLSGNESAKSGEVRVDKK